MSYPAPQQQVVMQPGTVVQMGTVAAQPQMQQPPASDDRDANKRGGFFACLIVAFFGIIGVSTKEWATIGCKLDVPGQKTQYARMIFSLSQFRQTGDFGTFDWFNYSDCNAKWCDDMQKAGDSARALMALAITFTFLAGTGYYIIPRLISNVQLQRRVSWVLAGLAGLFFFLVAIVYPAQLPEIPGACFSTKSTKPTGGGSYSNAWYAWTSVTMLFGATWVALRESGTGWRMPLANFWDNCGSCCYGCCCTSCMAGQMRARFTGQDCCGPCLMVFCSQIFWCAYCFVLGGWRTEMRQAFGLPGSKAEDRTIHIPCGCTLCGLTQESKELNFRLLNGMYSPGMYMGAAGAVMAAPGQAPMGQPVVQPVVTGQPVGVVAAQQPAAVAAQPAAVQMQPAVMTYA